MLTKLYLNRKYRPATLKKQVKPKWTISQENRPQIPLLLLLPIQREGLVKSTLAFISCLNLAVKQPDFHIEFIDLDRQGTTQDSLRRFTNKRFCLIDDPEFLLASGGPNNARIYQHLSSNKSIDASYSKRFVFFDTPAGTNFIEYSFLNDADYLFVPTSSSDADLFATRKFLSQLFSKGQGI